MLSQQNITMNELSSAVAEPSERDRHRLKAVLGERPCELHSGASGMQMPAGFAAVTGFE
jgi:hypothetical protein